MKTSQMVATKIQLESLISKLNDYSNRKSKIKLHEVGEVTTQATPSEQIPSPSQEASTVIPVSPGVDNSVSDESVSVENVILQLNTIRAGKSLKDDSVKTEISRYFDGLEKTEKEALYSYLKGISQIVSGQIDAGAANEPKDRGIETLKTGKKMRTIKPNVIKGTVSTTQEPTVPASPAQPSSVPAQTQQASSKENTAAPAPIVPKKR